MKLAYMETALARTQRRFAGQLALFPEIDLAAYTPRAVIDWVDVSFYLARVTQFRFVQETLAGFTTRKPWVVPNGNGPSGTDNTFHVRLQEPSLSSLRRAVDAVHVRFGFSGPTFVSSVEVSLDFFPKHPSEQARELMVAVLTRHLWPNRNITTGHRLNVPRFVWGKKNGHTAFTMHEMPEDKDRLLNVQGDRPPAPDATYYLGQPYAQAMWRVMDKTTDRRNPDKDDWEGLSDDKKRARVEVRLDRLELKRLGVATVEDLLEMNFARLQGQFFQFMCPTFPILPSNPAVGWLEEQRLRRFLSTGVVGLQAMDDERSRLRHTHRPELVRTLRKAGKPAHPQARSGRGRNGLLTAYDGLNARAEGALRKMMERERRSMEGL